MTQNQTLGPRNNNQRGNTNDTLSSMVICFQRFDIDIISEEFATRRC